MSLEPSRRWAAPMVPRGGLFIQCPQGLTPPTPGMGLGIGNVQGIRQAGYNWHRKMDANLKDKGFRPALADPCFYMRTHKAAITYLILHVDDFRVASSDPLLLDAFVAAMRQDFDIKVVPRFDSSALKSTADRTDLRSACRTTWTRC